MTATDQELTNPLPEFFAPRMGISPTEEVAAQIVVEMDARHWRVDNIQPVFGLLDTDQPVYFVAQITDPHFTLEFNLGVDDINLYVLDLTRVVTPAGEVSFTRRDVLLRAANSRKVIKIRRTEAVYLYFHNSSKRARRFREIDNWLVTHVLTYIRSFPVVQPFQAERYRVQRSVS